MPKMRRPGSTKGPESQFYGLGATARKSVANLTRDAGIHLRQFILTCELSPIASSSPKSQCIKHKLFHGLLAPISGFTSASSARFYPRALFRHSGNVLVFADKTRMNYLVENRQPAMEVVLGIDIFVKLHPYKTILPFS
jgi:hypothetical protein